MKKMNRKGFTLIELLAVIVVLAIILVITVPMVLNSLSSTRQDALQSSANSARRFYKEQLSMKALGEGEKDFLNDLIFNTTTGKVSNSVRRCITKEEAKILGLNTDDYSINPNCDSTTVLDEIEMKCYISADDKGTSDTSDDVNFSIVSWDTDANFTVELYGKPDGKFDGLDATSE